MKAFRARWSRWRLMGLAAVGTVAIFSYAAMGDGNEEARRAQCVNNLKAIWVAIYTYEGAHNAFPTGEVPNAALLPDQRLGWMPLIAESSDPARPGVVFDHDLPYDSTSNVSSSIQFQSQVAPAATGRDEVLGFSKLLCPSHPSRSWPGTTASSPFVGISGLGPDSATLPTSDPRAGVFGYDRTVRLMDVRDGLSHTMMVAEVHEASGPWASGAATIRAVDPARRPYIGPGRDFGGNHGEGGLVLMADGSVKTVKPTINPSVFEAISTIGGGEILSSGDSGHQCLRTSPIIGRHAPVQQ